MRDILEEGPGEEAGCVRPSGDGGGKPGPPSVPDEPDAGRRVHRKRERRMRDAQALEEPQLEHRRATGLRFGPVGDTDDNWPDERHTSGRNRPKRPRPLHRRFTSTHPYNSNRPTTSFQLAPFLGRAPAARGPIFGRGRFRRTDRVMRRMPPSDRTAARSYWRWRPWPCSRQCLQRRARASSAMILRRGGRA